MADANERSPLLGHEGGDQPAQLTQSSRSLNKDPEATAEEVKMADTAVGERLKYNDYTTIDWLHDLVRFFTYIAVSSKIVLIDARRLKTQTACAPSMVARAHVIAFWPCSMKALAGLLLHSLELLLHVSLIWSMSRKLLSAIGSSDTANEIR